MARQKIIAGNWKMNKSIDEASQLVIDIIENCPVNDIHKIIFPSFPYLTTIASLLKVNKSIALGAQNCSEHASGAYTGEVSATMLASVGCKYVLVGHSERRHYFNETSPVLEQKINQIILNKMIPIYCIGETLAERKNNQHFDVVKQQLSEVLLSFNVNDLSTLILAYEPVWAIGTGETASPQQAQEMHSYIRSCIKSSFNEAVANSIQILYGGSCNAQNAKELFACADIDGGLIGGASLKAEDFCKIIASV